MRASDLKKKDRFNTQIARPIGYPVYLIAIQKEGEEIIVGEYGCRKNSKNEYEYFIDDGWIKNHKIERKKRQFTWINQMQVLERVPWSPKIQEDLEAEETAKTQPIKEPEILNTQGKMAFQSEQMTFKINANGEIITLISNFKGELLNSKSKHRFVTEYLDELTKKNGRDKISFEYQYT